MEPNIINGDEIMQRVIVCAANQYGDHIICGARHHDKVMNNQLRKLKDLGVTSFKGATQGFIDQYGVFLNRTEAWVVATEADQIVRRCLGDDIDGGTLYSENLY
jgi:hypothetical protein